MSDCRNLGYVPGRWRIISIASASAVHCSAKTPGFLASRSRSIVL